MGRITRLADGSDLNHAEVIYVTELADYPGWFDDPDVVAARQKSHFAHRVWTQAVAPDGLTIADATPLQRLLYERLISADVAYEVAKQRAMERLSRGTRLGMGGKESPDGVGRVQGR